MAKLKCPCGHIIADQSDNIPYKGYILPDTKVDQVSDVLTEAIDSLAIATKNNSRDKWIENNFNVPPYSKDLKDASMISDLIDSKLVEAVQQIFQCEKCDRIAIQVGQLNLFKFFSPDQKDSSAIFG